MCLLNLTYCISLSLHRPPHWGSLGPRTWYQMQSENIVSEPSSHTTASFIHNIRVSGLDTTSTFDVWHRSEYFIVTVRTGNQCGPSPFLCGLRPTVRAHMFIVGTQPKPRNPVDIYPRVCLSHYTRHSLAPVDLRGENRTASKTTGTTFKI